MDNRQKFVELAKRVPDADSYFVIAMERKAKKEPDNVINDMVEFLQNNPKATSSDVLEKLADYIPFEEQYEKGVDDSFFDDEDGEPLFPVN